MHTLTLVNSSTTNTATSVSVTLPSPFFFEGGTYPGTGGDCGSTLTGSGFCTIKIYAQRATAGVVTPSIGLSYHDGASTVTKSFPIRAEFGSTAATKLLIVLPGQTFVEGSLSGTPISGSPLVYEGRPFTLQVIALTPHNYKATNHTQFAEAHSNQPDNFSAGGNMVAGQKNFTVTLNGTTSRDIYAYSGNLEGAQVHLSTSVQPYCAAPPASGSSGFQDGLGTEANPWIVCSMAQMISVPATAGKYYALNRDLWFSGPYTPTLGANCSGGFAGVFDGRGHMISNFYPTAVSEGCVGLFGRINGGTVKNLKIDVTAAQGNALAGGKLGALAGEIAGAGSVVNNVWVNWNLSSTTNAEVVGGFAGRMAAGNVAGVRFTVGGSDSLISEGDVGGIFGIMDGGILSAAAVEGEFGSIGSIRTQDNTAHIGGLVGSMGGGSIMRSRVGNQSNSLNMYEGLHMGGLVGLMVNSSSVVDSYARVIGNAGGATNMGGLIGWAGPGTTLERSYYFGTGMFSTGGAVGGIVGLRDASATLTSTYYNTDLFPSPPSSVVGGGGSTIGGDGMTDAQMYNPANFTGWNFTSGVGAWMMLPGSIFPVLQWEMMSEWDYSFNGSWTYSENNTVINLSPGHGLGSAASRLSKSQGKWYWEVTVEEGEMYEYYGIMRNDRSNADLPGEDAFTWGLYSSPDGTGWLGDEGNFLAGNATHRPRTGDTLRFMLDLSGAQGVLRIFRNTTEIKHPDGSIAFTDIPLGGNLYRAAFGINQSGEWHKNRTNSGSMALSTRCPAGYKPYNYLGP